MWGGANHSKRAKSMTAPGRFCVDSPISKALHFIRYGFRWRRGVNNGDRSSATTIVVRGALPHDRSIRYPDSSGLAVRRIFLLSVQEDGHRLVFPVRRAHGFGRSGRHLQALSFVPARARDSVQRRYCIGVQRKLGLEPPRSYVLLSYFGYLTGIVGTGIWGYGDVLVGLMS